MRGHDKYMLFGMELKGYVAFGSKPPEIYPETAVDFELAINGRRWPSGPHSPSKSLSRDPVVLEKTAGWSIKKICGSFRNSPVSPSAIKQTS
jgi:hypothetical protein